MERINGAMWESKQYRGGCQTWRCRTGVHEVAHGTVPPQTRETVPARRAMPLLGGWVSQLR